MNDRRAARYARAHFLDSVARTAQLPPDSGREVAFAGRSNAGKSSALNALTGRRALARTSRTPGRTRLINLFDLGEDRRLVDLPGYGYAKVSRQMQADWQRLLTAYLGTRRSLAGTVLVCDIRRGITERDWHLIDLLMEAGCPLHVLLTKADKLGRAQQARALEEARRTLEEAGVEATLQPFSATKRTGVDDLQGILDEWLESAADSEAKKGPDAE